MINIAKYYYYKIVYMGGKENNIYNNVYKELDIIKTTSHKPNNLIIFLKLVGVKISIKKG